MKNVGMPKDQHAVWRITSIVFEYHRPQQLLSVTVLIYIRKGGTASTNDIGYIDLRRCVTARPAVMVAEGRHRAPC